MPVRSRARPRIESPPPDSPPNRNSDTTLQNLSSPTREMTDDRPRKKTKLVIEPLTTAKGRVKVSRKKTTTREDAMRKARSLRRHTDLFANVPQAINVGRAYRTLEEYKSLGPEDEEYEEEEKEYAEHIIANCGNQVDRLVKVYDAIMNSFSSEQREYINSLGADEDREFWREVHSHADNGRNDDTSNVKDNAYQYVLKTGSLSPSLSSQTKANRGVSHPQLMREIVPMSVLHKYGAEENFEDMVKAKTFKLKHDRAPAFLYDRDLWDSENPDVGLFKGHFLIRILRMILLGRKAALAEPGTRTSGTRQNNAEIAGLTKITPELIAYACVHARFFICKLETYAEDDGDFNFRRFYYWILKFFEEADEDWVKDTLAFWNAQIFGPCDETVLEDDEDDEDETSFSNILALQKERKARQLAQQPASQTQPDSQYTQAAFANRA